MKKNKIIGLLALLILAMSTTAQNIGDSIKNFSLLNVDGKTISLTDYPKAKGFMMIFSSNHCPFAKLYPARLNEINAKYSRLGIPVIAISSTDTISYEEDNFDKMVAKASNEHFNFPYLYDATQGVAKDFKAQKTPHAFIIWKENERWIIKYNGAIDDNGMHADLVQKHYLTDAADQLLAGQAVTIPETKSIGCQIYFRK